MPTASASPLVGRSNELGRLSTAVGLAPGAGSASGSVLLAGDAGVGKTRLLAELRDHAQDNGWRVVVGHCIDLGDSGLPYLPFSDAFGQLAAESPALAQLLADAGPAIERLLPARRMMAGGTEPPSRTDRGDLFESVHAALARLSVECPVLLIVEDVHWADQSTRDLLSFLFARGFGSPVAVVASYRSDDLHRRHPLRPALAEWGRLPGVTRLALEPLRDTDVRMLVKQLHDDPMPEAEISTLVARAEGNAFFVEELVSATLMGPDLGPETLPADLADLLLVRLERLDEDGRTVVRAAAVAGRRVPHAWLAAVAGLDEDRLDQALRAAVDANVLVGAETYAGYAFRHALLAEAVYDDLLPGERVRLHAGYAAALGVGQLQGTAAELARHARAARDVPTAIRASIQAGDEAMTVGGPDEAARHYEVALSLLAESPDDAPSDVDQVELTVRAGEAAAAAGHLFRGLALVQDGLARLPGDATPEQRASLLIAVGSIALLADTGIDVIELTSEATKLLPEDSQTRLRARAALVHAQALDERGRDDLAHRWATEAQRLARALDCADIAVDAATTLARIDRRVGDPEASRRNLESAIAEAHAAGEASAEIRGLVNLGGLHYEHARLAEARAAYGAAADLTRRVGRPWAPYGIDARALSALVAHVQGDWDGSRHILDVRGESPPPLAEAMLSAVELAVLAGRGSDRVLALRPHLQPWWARDGFIAIVSGGALMEAYANRGDIEAVLKVHDEIYDVVTALWQRKSFAGQIRLGAIAVAALASEAGRTSTRDRAELVARGESLAGRATEALEVWQWRTPGPEAQAWLARLEAERLRLSWAAGLEVPVDALVAAWRETLVRFELFGHVPETARTKARLAAVLRADGQTAEADELVADARATATRLGAQPLLAELGGSTATVNSRAVPRTSDDALTARELEVLALVAEGRSNREIAGQLFISAKTVSVHVSNILAKLGAGGRTEAVAIARRRGVL